VFSIRRGGPCGGILLNASRLVSVASVKSW
jgi:hypothetical protein